MISSDRINEIIDKRGAIMRDLILVNSFTFKTVHYSKYHENNFSAGIRHNYLMYLKSGSGKICTQTETIDMSEGDLLYIPCKTKYSVKLYGNPDICFNSYGFLDYPGSIMRKYVLHKVNVDNKISNYIDIIEKKDVSYCFVLGYFYLLLDEIMKKAKPEITNKDSALVEKAINLISEHQNSSISDIAKKCNVSEKKLYALFEKHTGMTPAKLRLKVKLERSVHLLISTDASIEEISQVCGFSSYSYFRKKFCDVYQMTPSQMRKNGTIESDVEE